MSIPIILARGVRPVQGVGGAFAMNILRTGILLAALTALLLAFGSLLGRETGVLIALIVSIGMNAFTYWNGDKMVLSMHGAEEIDRQSAPEFYDIIAELAGR